MEHYCTYFDRYYLVQGVALYRSLSAVSNGPFTLWVLCFDDAAHDTLSRLGIPGLRPVSLRDLEAGDAALLEAKKNRSKVEYYFTCSPSWPLYLLDRNPEIGRVTYLDADLLFYSDPAPIFGEMGEASVLIVGHRFPEALRHLEVYGIYNVSLVSFRNDPRGMACLAWWRERCLEWCFDRVEGHRFADQKYLDDWPERFPGVAVLRHPGAGLAPWNWSSHRILNQEGKTTVDGGPLIFFHYQGFKIINRWMFDLGLKSYGRMPPSMRRLIYRPYVAAIREAEQFLLRRVAGARIEYPRTRHKQYGWGKFMKRLRDGQILFAP